MLADGDLEGYTVKVHALKSSARIIGASGLSDMALKLEEAGKRKDLETDNMRHRKLSCHKPCVKNRRVLSVVNLSPVDYLLKTIDKNGLLQKLADFFRSRNV